MQMVAILLTTDTFRASPTVSRWRDPMGLAWLAVPLYWIHQFEEYSLPVIGLDYAIQEMICEKIGFPPYPDCPIPRTFYPVVNIARMWFGAPLAAYLFRRNVLIGLSFWGLVFANGLVHTAGASRRAPTTPDCGAPPSCLFRRPSGSFTPPRFADRTAARSWAWRTQPEPSHMSCFSSAMGFSRTGRSELWACWSMRP
jgi:hypothetical protein